MKSRKKKKEMEKGERGGGKKEYLKIGESHQMSMGCIERCLLFLLSLQNPLKAERCLLFLTSLQNPLKAGGAASKDHLSTKANSTPRISNKNLNDMNASSYISS